MNKKIIVISSLAITALTFASPVFAASADVTKIETFIKSIIQVFVTLAGLVSAGFFVWGGVDISPVLEIQKPSTDQKRLSGIQPLAW